MSALGVAGGSKPEAVRKIGCRLLQLIVLQLIERLVPRLVIICGDHYLASPDRVVAFFAFIGRVTIFAPRCAAVS